MHDVVEMAKSEIEHYSTPLLCSPSVLLNPNYTRLLHSFNGPLSRTTRVGRYQKGKTNLDFTEA